VWVLFRAPTLQGALEVCGRLVLPPFTSMEFLPPQWPVWLIGFVALSPFLDERVRGDRFLRLKVRWQFVVSALLLWLTRSNVSPP
jgi:hypothetical protein